MNIIIVYTFVLQHKQFWTNAFDSVVFYPEKFVTGVIQDREEVSNGCPLEFISSLRVTMLTIKARGEF